MKRSLNRALAAAILLLLVVPAQAACKASDASLNGMDLQTLGDFVRRSFDDWEYECGIRAVELRADLLAASNDAQAVDGRFALRNLAITLGKVHVYTSAERLALLRAAASTLRQPSADAGDVKFDVMMAMKAGRNFQQDGDFGSTLEAVALAIRLDQKLPAKSRTLQSWELNSLIPQSHDAHKYFGELLVLAEMTRGDPALADFRSGLAPTLYYGATARLSADARESSLERADQLLRLAAALDDVKNCNGCLETWRWRLIMAAGTAYYQLGVTGEGAKQIDRAVGIARSTDNPNHRLGQYRFVLSELVACKYERGKILALMDEMKALADSLDTPMAKEVRESLPRIAKNWGLER